ncbi:putative RNA-directed DNA polymerase [Helianthus annuus]|nr:putative RNA-directed DNA polymerase [Helianthus annuus]
MGMHILNRCVTTTLADKVPEEVWSERKPSVDYFKVFGCIGYVHIPAQLRSKLDHQSHKCIFVGISTESKAYRMYDPVKGKVIISKDVTFLESEKWEWKKTDFGSTELLIPDSEAMQESDTIVDQPREEVVNQDQGGDGMHQQQTPQANGEGNEEGLSQLEVGTISRRTRSAPVWMDDYQTREGLSDEEGTEFVMFSSFGDPTSFEEAIKEDKWKKAMECEIDSIERNQAWELVKAPNGVKPIGVKWVYKTKLNERGQVDKYKARLVVKGYAQRKGVDYEEVFAPVARWDTIRTLLALAAQKSWVVYQLDVKSAFLHGELKENVFVTQPQGFEKKGDEEKVYKLKRALYGLKQAPRAWFKRIEGYFLKEGFKRSSFDHTLFIKKVWNKIVIVSLYVDDLIYMGNDQMLCEGFKKSIMQEFEMTDLGRMKYFLGVEITQYKGGIGMCQKKYAKEILERLGK